MLNSVKEVLVKEVEVSDIKAALLKEININELKEVLVKEVKELLLKEIDVTDVKKMLLTDIEVKDLFSSESKTQTEKTTKMPIDDALKVAANTTSLVDKELKDSLTVEQHLIDSLKKEHEEMIFLYNKIMEKSKEKNYTTLPVMLARFSTKCLYHFNAEEELYTLIKKVAKERSQFEVKVAVDFSREMQNLSESISTILGKANATPVSDETVDAFIQDFSQLGEKLNHRISREDKILYPMYEKAQKEIKLNQHRELETETL